MRAILTYHSIDPSRSVISVEPGAFERQVEWLAASGLTVTTLERVLALPPDAEAVALTFDDGFVNFATHAWPQLRARGWPVTVFVVADWVGRTNGWDPARGDVVRAPLLDWPTLGRLAEEGVTLGSHSRTHPDLRSCRDSLDDEIAGAAERIHAETGRRPEAFAYPFGLWDDRVRGAVGATHRVACTTELRPLGRRDDAFCLPRLDAYYLREPGRLESWGSPRFRRYLWLRARGRQMRRHLATPGGRP